MAVTPIPRGSQIDPQTGRSRRPAFHAQLMTHKAATFTDLIITTVDLIADLPVLGTENEGQLVHVLGTFNHLLEWNGTLWTFGPSDSGGGYFVQFGVAPDSTGWVVCDGAATTYLHITAAGVVSLQPFTTPVLAGYYFRR